MVPTRRQTIATLGAALAGIAGCFGVDNPNLVVENDRSRSVTADVKVIRMSDMRVIVWADRSIVPDETTAFPNPFDEPDEYRIRVLAPEANVGGEETFRVDAADAVEVRAVVGSDGVRFTRTSA
jgi:hypothetical protein